jgi:NAD dependent epimerase/dehydratase
MKTKVLITGADGFIGSHLTELLIEKNFHVKALSQYNSFNDWGWLEDVNCKNNIEIVSGDIRDLNFCRHITKDIDIVFHLAALIAIPFSYVSPQSYLDTNIKGTLNICQASKDNKVSRVIHTSTSEVYGTAKYVPIDEKHPLQPQSPYSATKIAADSIAMSFYNAFDTDITIARPFNTFGPRQSARAVIPSIIVQAATGIDQILLGDTSPTRDFNYVEDTCRGFLKIAESNETSGKTLNIGSGKEISIEETFNEIKKIMNAKIRIKKDKIRLRPKKSEVYRLLADYSELKNITNYEPKTSFTDGLKKTIEWILKPENLNRYKAKIYNV